MLPVIAQFAVAPDGRPEVAPGFLKIELQVVELSQAVPGGSDRGLLFSEVLLLLLERSQHGLLRAFKVPSVQQLPGVFHAGRVHALLQFLVAVYPLLDLRFELSHPLPRQFL